MLYELVSLFVLYVDQNEVWSLLAGSKGGDQREGPALDQGTFREE